ncbi:pilus (MSHA type) biogenesis protein MshL [Aeromonas hydrophila]|uniref:Msha biogenesis protein mshl n=1 Tax=Aeromonas hydrophila subsp. hydrophila (strain ATCC 7966 / DSM 30187 / BCRC 13018 / CCUG 14551 / JCM 1027 / KCTC 2358 / NCIMB 9240 / NCTC 8049) TaxID=380703 RepID=A0KF96_AERHH|nr:pilus (MSHA type) biogenesis protein MshL [Aeromonas hydrophila]ABK38588.1 msha biogenesis protein mshl [Aeromonas hydrophila subsp. hydrophila ATCC 7966]MBS4673621.1 pilus (MSHA type) biogenesis protein MshL [Aeromonas hydrophila]OOD34621.1 pilus (MSHA type) biogenesis protein MshL [Aeromonas hydrophila]TNH88683.1 pilus (MSHA type) biogenesis protein MshL [Aeromonas hydrophila]TNI00640.1 pilus (MSHA type) biogenesis protein MshL [Aeromonas hydrophila]
MKKHHLCLISAAVLTAGCTSYRHPEPVQAKDALRHAMTEQNKGGALTSVPKSVQSELLQLNRPPQAISMPEPRLRIAAHDVDAVEFFGSLFKGSRYSVAVHPGVAGQISVELKDVTLTEVLAVVGDMYGFDVQRKGNVFHVYPAGLRTETIPVNYLMMSRRGLSRTSVSTGGVASNDNNSSNNNNFDNANNSTNNSTSNRSSNGSSNSDSNGTRIETDTSSDYWTDLRDTLQTLIGSGDGRAVITSPQAGLVTIRAYPKELKAVREFLNQSESHLKRQVVLEARILEVALNEGYEQGVDWSGLSASWDGNKGITGGGSLTPSTIANTPNQIFSALGGGAGFKISDGNFNVAVNLLKTQGDVNTLSSPRVTATNNQKAVIKVGTDEYFVTNASTTTTTSGTSAPIVTPNVELTPFFSGIALDVTPQIDEEGKVLLHIHPSVIDTEEQKKTIDVGTADPLILPLAKSSIRESDTVVQANNGDIIVIGGLMKTDKQEIVSKVPLLGDIPWVGEAFTNRRESTKKVELVILLKPTVVEKDTWQNELQRSSELLDKWYPPKG